MHPMPLVDLHVHTSRSYDGRDTPRAVVSAAASRGLAAIIVCDHDSVDGGPAARRAAEELGLQLLIVDGCEVSTREGHLLVMDCRNPPPPGLTSEETVRRARLAGALVVQPHPYDRFRHGMGRVVDGVDAVEVCNSRFFIGTANRRARADAERLGLPGVAGSDAHVAEMVGVCATEVPPFSSIRELRAHILAGRCRVVPGRTPAALFARQSAANAARRLLRALTGPR